MAYTNSPTNSTYKTYPVEFTGQDYFRTGIISGAGRDVRLINMFYDRVTKENERRIISLKKRPGLTSTTWSLNKLPGEVVRGYFYDVDSNYFYWVVGVRAYRLDPTTGTSIQIATFSGATTQVGFCTFLRASDNKRFVVYTDGFQLFCYDYATNTNTQVTDPNLPTPHQNVPVYLDGYLFLIGNSTSDLFNSNLDDPFTWSAGDFISAEISSDYSLAPVKLKNYLGVLGVNSIEYFYDNANTSGSPLSRNDSPFRGVGLVSGLCTIGDTTYFIGQDKDMNLSVYSLNSFKIERISNEVVDRTLQTISGTQNEQSQVPDRRPGYSLSVDGHNFYAFVTNTTTWVYDIDEKFWYEWRGAGGAGLAIQAVWQQRNGSCYVALSGQDYISVFSPNIYTDFGSNFTMSYTTEKIDVETHRWKFLNRVMVIADQHAVGSSTMNVYYSFDDWATTLGPRALDVFSESSYAIRWGRFREVSFRLEYTDNYPLRITGVELEVNVGTH